MKKQSMLISTETIFESRLQISSIEALLLKSTSVETSINLGIFSSLMLRLTNSNNFWNRKFCL